LILNEHEKGIAHGLQKK